MMSVIQRITLPCLLVTSLLAQDKAAPAEVTFKLAPPVVGEVYTIGRNFELAMSLEISAGEGESQTMEQSQNANFESKIHILAVEGGKLTSMKVETQADLQVMSNPGGEQEKESPLKGKTIQVTVNADGVAYTDEKGGELDVELMAEAKKRYKVVDGGIRVEALRSSAMLPKGPVKIGQTIELDEVILGGFFQPEHEKEDNALKSAAKMTLKEVRKVDGVDYGVFEMVADLKFQQGSEAMKGSMGPKGEVLFAIDGGYCRGGTMKGPFAMSGEVDAGGQMLQIEGTGDVQMKISLDRKPAPAPK